MGSGSLYVLRSTLRDHLGLSDTRKPDFPSLLKSPAATMRQEIMEASPTRRVHSTRFAFSMADLAENSSDAASTEQTDSTFAESALTVRKS